MSVSEITLSAIKALEPAVLASRGVITADNSGRGFVCPNCGSGTGKKGTGIKPNQDGNDWLYHCFACGKTFDNVALLALHYGLDSGNDFNEICRRACDDFGIAFSATDSFSSTAVKEKKPSATKEEEPAELELLELIHSDIKKARANLHNLPEKARRGLTMETLEHFNCGFIPDWIHPKSRIEGKYSTPTPRLIVPTPNHYLARLIVPVENFPENQRRYIHAKEHANSKETFNSTALNVGGVVIVVEGEMDVMSIWQATRGEIPVIAISGAAESKWIDRLPAKAQFLILLDNDNAGKNNAAKLRETLIQRGYPAAVAFLSNSDTKIDANDILRRNGEAALAVKVKELLSVAQDDLEKAAAEIVANKEREKLRELQEKFPAAAALIEDFQSSAEAFYFANEFEERRAIRRQFLNRKTGFENLDREGAQIFLPGLYVLGGLPAIGKTSFATQLAEQCANNGEYVIYLSYEMDVDFLRAKTIARAVYNLDPFTNMTAAKIVGGYNNSAIEEVVSGYGNSARNFHIIRSNCDMRNLLTALEVKLATLDKPPLIIIDYLQRIPTDSRERREGVAQNVYALKDFQQKHNATIIALSSLNRDNYSAPISFESFKETGDIEYNADVIWGLQLYAVNGFGGSVFKNRQMKDRAMKRQPRELELVCVKNRFGSPYNCFFHYFSAHDYFQPYLHEPDSPYHFGDDFDPAAVEREGEPAVEEDECSSGNDGGNMTTLPNGDKAYFSGVDVTSRINEEAYRYFCATHHEDDD